DARGRCAAIVREARAGGGEALREVAQPGGAFAPLAQPAAALRGAEAVVPFEPARRQLPEPVATGAEVPGLGDAQRARQHRVLRDGREEGRARIEAALRVAAQHGREVEAEAVDAHLA